METLTRKASNALLAIQRFIESLYQTFLKYKAKSQGAEKLKTKLQTLDSNNREYKSIASDHRENMKMFWLMILAGLSIVVDFLATFESGRIISEMLRLAHFFMYCIPIVLVLLEIGISYFQIEAKRKGEGGSWLARNAQYLVMIIVCGFILLTIVFSIESYSNDADKVSFLTFLTGTLLYQIALLIFSLMLHLWIIRHSEAIFEAISYCHYKIARSRIVRKIDKLENEKNDKGLPGFSGDTQKLMQMIETFRQENPEANVDFSKTMPAELLLTINQIMGRKCFVLEQDNVQ